MLLRRNDASVDHRSRLRGGTRRNANDQLIALVFLILIRILVGTRSKAVASLDTCKVSVDVGVRAEFLNEVDFDRNGAFDIFTNQLKSLGTEADDDRVVVFWLQSRNGGIRQGNASSSEDAPVAFDLETTQVHCR